MNLIDAVVVDVDAAGCDVDDDVVVVVVAVVDGHCN